MTTVINRLPKSEERNYNDRPTFHYRFARSKPIRAGGVLYYKKVGDSIEILLIKRDDKDYYEDVGGKTSPEDKNVFDTVAREVDEETNKKMPYEIVMEQIKKSPSIYVKNSKYILFLVEATPEQQLFTTEDFSNLETHENVSRTIHWVDMSIYMDKKHAFNPRMETNKLKEELSDISLEMAMRNVTVS